MTPEFDLYQRLKGVGAIAPTAPSEGSVVEAEVMKGDPDAGVPVSIRNLFTHHDSHPVVLDFALIKAFGVAWFNWEAETLWAEIQRTFQTQISELTRAKIQTVKTCHVSLLPWAKWQVFEKVIQGLNNVIPRFDTMQAPSVEQLYAGIDILDTLRRQPFEDEVRLYMAAALLHDDIIYAPAPLDIIQTELSHPHYQCLDCGSEDSALFHDGVCFECSRRWENGTTLAGRPDPEAGNVGRNLKVVLKYDPDSTERLWDLYKTKPTNAVADELPETQEGVHVARLLVARDYMNVRRRQLADQLTSLKTWLGAT
jgi:hypothetical protein